MQPYCRIRWLIGAGFAAIVSITSPGAAQAPNAFAAIAREFAIHGTASDGVSARPAERDAIRRLYDRTSSMPLWSTDGSPTRQARQAIDALGAVATRGLVPADYDGDALRSEAALAFSSDTAVARFDVALSRSMIRLLADLHMGRTTPQLVGFDLPSAHARLDLAALMLTVSRASDVPAAISTAEPPYAGYAALKRLLERYRVLAADTSLRLPRRDRRTIRPGGRYPDAPTLLRLLAALGDATATTVLTDSLGVPIFDGPLVDAVTRFQRRHGLDGDGVIGPATMAQLRTPLAQRVRQIELTLERWRWFPDRPPERYAVVNVPAFRLYAFEHDSTAHEPVLAMNVIVGQAQGRRGTPVFVGTMQEVVFRPYWDVPTSIARKELIPQFRRRPASFEKEEFEIVRRGDGDVGAVLHSPTEANFARILSGSLRLRQRPGPQNALGFIKFVFPNRYNVYLHGTPAQQLFAETRRDFSHGCIRIEAPPDLAELVLEGQAPWDRPAIEAAMADTQTVHVPIARPMVVYVLYATAIVDGNGAAHFYSDLYGHDRTLDRALTAHE